VGVRFNKAEGAVSGVTGDAGAKRWQLAGGWFVTSSVLVKAEYVDQRLLRLSDHEHPQRRKVSWDDARRCDRVLEFLLAEAVACGPPPMLPACISSEASPPTAETARFTAVQFPLPRSAGLDISLRPAEKNLLHSSRFWP
jgi:hypothetical protein